MLDSEQKGEVYATDIADMITNALGSCPDATERSYPHMMASVVTREKTDKQCRCPIYQEMLELYNAYYERNRKQFNFTKFPIVMHEYCTIVKLSVLGVEFRDKLLRRNVCPMLLKHSN